MTQQTFINGMRYLKGFYLNFGFDEKNGTLCNIWYSALSSISDGTFLPLIKEYTIKNHFPPQSPSDLLAIVRENICVRPASSAWARTIELLHQYGLIYGREEIFKACKNEPALLQTIKDYECELKLCCEDDHYLADKFKKTYEIYAKRESEKQMNEFVGIGNISEAFRLKQEQDLRLLEAEA